MPIKSRPRTRIGNGPPLVRKAAPTASTPGPITTARRRWCVRKRPIGMSAVIRAKPKALATTPSCQSASPLPRATSGRIAGKAPSENVFERLSRHRSTISGVTRPFMVNHWLMAKPKTIRLEVTGPVARLTLDRPEVLNAGDASFARDLNEVVATIGARPAVRVVVMIGVARAKELILLGEPVSARTAEHYGLVNRVVAPADFARALEDTVARFLALPPSSVTASKRLTTRAFDLDFETFRKEMQVALAACVESPEHRRAMEAIRARKRGGT